MGSTFLLLRIGTHLVMSPLLYYIAMVTQLVNLDLKVLKVLKT